MKRVLLYFLLASGVLWAQGKYARQTLEEKESRRDLCFLVTFDQYHAGAKPAGGENMPYTVKDMNLQLRGLGLMAPRRIVPWSERICATMRTAMRISAREHW